MQTLTFNRIIDFRGYPWRVVGEIRDGEVRLEDVFFIHKRTKVEVRVGAGSLNAFRTDPLLMKAIREEVANA